MNSNFAEVNTTFKQAWALFLGNAVIVVPGLVTAFLSFVPIVLVVLAAIGIGVSIVAISQPADAQHEYTALASAGIVACAIIFLGAALLVLALAVAQTTFLTGLAEGVWLHGKVRFDDGWTAIRERAFEVLWGTLLLIAIGIGALILAPFTLLLSLPAYLVFFMYVSTLIVVGKRSATEAISESCRIAFKDFGPTVIIAVVSFAVAIFSAIVGSMFSQPLFFLGGVVAMILPIAGRTYVALVIVGHYLELEGHPIPQ